MDHQEDALVLSALAMNRTQSDDLVDRVYVVWRIESTIQDRKKAKEVWWEFIHDLDFDAVRKVLNGKALIGGYPPRPGEVRVEAKIGRLPLASDAWDELQRNREKVNSGGMADHMSPLAAATVNRLRSQAGGLNTNADRNLFVQTFTRVLEEFIAEECQLTPLPN